MQVLRRWAMEPPPDVRLLVVLDRPVAVYSGMVPGFVAGDYPMHALEIEVLPLARRAGAGVILAAARDIDPVRHEISFEGRPRLRYDLASINVGSTVRGLDLPGVSKHALATRPIGHFIDQIDAQVESFVTRNRPARVLVVGGGAAGMELACTLDARLRAAGVTPALGVVSGDRQLLGGTRALTRRAAAAEAEARGIGVTLERRVVHVDDAGVIVETTRPGSTDGQDRLPADLVVWATGAAPSAFPEGRGVGRLATDEQGFLEVRDTLQTTGFDDVFAAGDCARLVDHRWVPRAGVYAVRQGPILDHNLRAHLRGQALKPYRPQRDFLSLLHLGEGRALGSKWGFAVRGAGVLRLKDWIDRRFMSRFQILDESGRPRPDLAGLGAMAGSASRSRSPDGTGADPGGAHEDGMPCGGCAAKLGAQPLTQALAELPAAARDASVLLGLDARDDVAATRNAAGDTTLHNVDVIRAFCDDPWLVGRVAASNAVSDLYAKGGRPRYAQAVIGLPDIDPAGSQELLFQTLSGVREILDTLGVTLLGGHTTIGDELTVGLSVTGEGPDERALVRQAGARPGDDLLLSQPLGTGVVLAADMRGLARADWVEAAHTVMQHTNEIGSRLADIEAVHAATDVTGFGLAGHLLTLLEPADLVARIDRDRVPRLPGADLLWSSHLRSTAHPANRAAFSGRTSGASDADEAWLFDPQTAGGLLLAVAPEQGQTVVDLLTRAGHPAAACIGRISEASDTRDIESAGDRRGRIVVVAADPGVEPAAHPPRDRSSDEKATLRAP